MRITETILYVDREDVKKVEEEERESFIRNVVSSFELSHPDYPDFEEIWPENKEMDPDKLILLKKFLSEFEIEIIRYGSREVVIYVNGEPAAEWQEPFVALRTDMSVNNSLKRVFAEMRLRFGTAYGGE